MKVGASEWYAKLKEEVLTSYRKAYRVLRSGRGLVRLDMKQGRTGRWQNQGGSKWPAS